MNVDANAVPEEQKDSHNIFGQKKKKGKDRKKKGHTGETTKSGDELLQENATSPLEEPTLNEGNSVNDASESWSEDMQLPQQGTKAIEDVKPGNGTLPQNPSYRKELNRKEIQTDDPSTHAAKATNPNLSNEVMDRIYRQLHNFRTESPNIVFGREITGLLTLSDVEADLKTIIRNYLSCSRDSLELEKLHRDLEDEYVKLKTKYTDDLAEKTKLLSRNKREREEMEREKDKKIHNLQGRIDTLNMLYNNKDEQQQIKIDAIEEKHKLATTRLNSDKRNLKNVHDRTLEEQKRQHSDALNKRDTDFKTSYTAAVTQLENQIRQLQNSLHTKDSDHDKELEQLKHSLREEQGRSGRRLEKEKLLASEQISKAKKSMDQELLTAQQSYSAQLESTQRLLDDTIQERTGEIEKARAGFEVEKANTIRHFEAKKTEIERQMQADRQDLESQIVEVQKQLQAEVTEKSKAISSIRAEMVVKHNKEKRAIKESNQALKEALVARDHFKAMSDEELAYRFEEIGSEVGEFAQVVWDKRRESSWPFDDQSFQRSENKRRMKGHVLQNTMWVILYDNIFCTPFRVFGKEGKGTDANSLETEWVKAYDPVECKLCF